MCGSGKIPSHLFQFHKMKVFVEIVVVALIIVSNTVFAQNTVSNTYLAFSIDGMRSTHSTYFTGVGIAGMRQFSKIFSGGAGLEYSYCPYHNDNGWDLTRLNFLPVFLLQKIQFFEKKRVGAYAQLQEGVSFVTYYRKPQFGPGSIALRKETGFYGYGGLGAGFRATNRVRFFIDAGIKSFHISKNVLDVNPHGITGRLGLVYKLL